MGGKLTSEVFKARKVSSTCLAMRPSSGDDDEKVM